MGALPHPPPTQTGQWRVSTSRSSLSHQGRAGGRKLSFSFVEVVLLFRSGKLGDSPLTAYFILSPDCNIGAKPTLDLVLPIFLEIVGL